MAASSSSAREAAANGPTRSFTNNEVAIITGASSGIGAGAAVKLAERGVKRFCLTGRNQVALEETKMCCVAVSKGNVKEDDVIIVNGELKNDSFCEEIVNSAIENFNQIDILVNNAGILFLGPFETASLKDYDRVMNINVRALVGLTQLCIPHLKKTKGTIINISSVSGIRSFPHVGYYCMSKAMVNMFTQCLALELAESGIRVNAVNPGVIVTEIHKRTGMSDEQYASVLESTKTTHPIGSLKLNQLDVVDGRYGEVEEVANAIAFLASSEASFMTGNLMPIDGGRNITCPR